MGLGMRYGMKIAGIRTTGAVALLIIASALSAPSAGRVRSVSGVVIDRRGNTLKGAAVQIENTASLQIASSLTRDDGRYFFHQLNPDIDYTLKAKYKRWWSKPKNLSKFDSKETAEINLEIPVE